MLEIIIVIIINHNLYSAVYTKSNSMGTKININSDKTSLPLHLEPSTFSPTNKQEVKIALLRHSPNLTTLVT